MEERPNRNGCIVLDDYLTMACVYWHDQVKVLQIDCGLVYVCVMWLSNLMYKYVHAMRCCNLFGLLFKNYKRPWSFATDFPFCLILISSTVGRLGPEFQKASACSMCCTHFCKMFNPLCIIRRVFECQTTHTFTCLPICLNSNAMRFVLTIERKGISSFILPKFQKQCASTINW